MSDDIHTVGDNQKPPTHQEDSQQEGGKSDPQFSVSTPPHTDKSKRGQNGSCHKLKYRMEWVFKFLEAAAFVFIILTFWEMRQTRLDDERAWISLNGAGLSLPYSKDHVGIWVPIVNSGKTPAFIKSVDISVSIAPLDGASARTLYSGHLGDSVAAPNSSSMLKMSNPTPIGEQEFTMLTERKMEVHFSVKIVYLDVFNKIRHTEQGFTISGPQNELGPGGFIPSFGAGRME